MKSNWTEITSRKIDILEKKNSNNEKIKKTWKKLNIYLEIIFIIQNNNACIFFIWISDYFFVMTARSDLICLLIQYKYIYCTIKKKYIISKMTSQVLYLLKQMIVHKLMFVMSVTNIR